MLRGQNFDKTTHLFAAVDLLTCQYNLPCELFQIINNASTGIQ